MTAVNKNLGKSAIAAEVVGQVLTLTFASGEVLTVNAAELNGTIREQALMYGLKQKLVDAASISRDTETGRTANVADKYRAVREVYLRITGADAQWNKGREGGASGSANGLLVRALAELTGKVRKEVEEFLESKGKEERQALRKNPKVAAIISRLQSENVDDRIDTDAMLDELA